MRRPLTNRAYKQGTTQDLNPESFVFPGPHTYDQMSNLSGPVQTGHTEMRLPLPGGDYP